MHDRTGKYQTQQTKNETRSGFRCAYHAMCSPRNNAGAACEFLESRVTVAAYPICDKA